MGILAVSTDKGGIYAIASIIQEALEGFASGRFETQVEVKRFLESQPVYPKDLPNGQIRNQRITELLTRVAYAGYVEAPKWKIPLTEGQHEGLVSLATWQRIQDRLTQGAKAPARKDLNKDFPLRGFVLCGDCDKPLTACWSKGKSKRYAYYLCRNQSCISKGKSIPRDRIEDAFETLLKQLTPTKGLLKVFRAMFKGAWNHRLSQATESVKAAKKQLKTVETRIDQFLSRIVRASNDRVINTYEQQIIKLEREKAILAKNRKIVLNRKAPWRNCSNTRSPFFQTRINSGHQSD